MRGSVSKYQIVLKQKQKKRLLRVVRRRTPSHWMVARAKVVLLSGERKSIKEVCAALSLDHQVVRRWRKRFIEKGVDGLRDRPRSGRPSAIQRQVWQKIATLVVQPPTKFGLPLARWSVRELSTFLDQRYGWQVSAASVCRFLRSMALKPHRVKYWLNPKDPEFDEKAARICELYLSPPPKTTVLCLDEKPGIQALQRLHPGYPMRSGRSRRVEFEYKRRGTRCVFAAFNVRTGHVIAEVTPDRKIPRVLAFLDRIYAAYSRGKIVIITDNIATRRGKDAKAWLATHRRATFVYTPFHGSWLNQVEIWLGILTAKCLRGRSFNSTLALSAAIRAFVRRWNRDMARPFKWTYSGRVLAA
jgi:transposase